PEGVEVRDFHALRCCFVSDVLRTGADLKQAMTLARHSDPRLTAGRYARTRLHDLGAVVNKLLKPTTATAAGTVLQATGTDGRPLGEQQGAATGAASRGSGQLRLRTAEESDEPDAGGAESQKTLSSQGFEDCGGRLRTNGAERAGF